MSHSNYQETADKITFILINQLLSNESAVYDGFKTLKENIARSIENNEPIRMLLPAFPCEFGQGIIQSA